MDSGEFAYMLTIVSNPKFDEILRLNKEEDKIPVERYDRDGAGGVEPRSVVRP